MAGIQSSRWDEMFGRFLTGRERPAYIQATRWVEDQDTIELPKLIFNDHQPAIEKVVIINPSEGDRRMH